MMRINRRWMLGNVAVAFAAAMVMMLVTPVAASNSNTIAVLGTHFQNDNEIYEPTSSAERARLEQVREALEAALANSRRFKVKQVPQPMTVKIKAGQPLGQCGRCELDFGAALSVDYVTWITVHKVSNLILNLNVYMADVRTKKTTFVQSVDIRGNSDESWSRSLTYLVKNYMLPNQS